MCGTSSQTWTADWPWRGSGVPADGKQTDDEKQKRGGVQERWENTQLCCYGITLVDSNLAVTSQRQKHEQPEPTTLQVFVWCASLPLPADITHFPSCVSTKAFECQSTLWAECDSCVHKSHADVIACGTCASTGHKVAALTSGCLAARVRCTVRLRCYGVSRSLEMTLVNMDVLITKEKLKRLNNLEQAVSRRTWCYIWKKEAPEWMLSVHSAIYLRSIPAAISPASKSHSVSYVGPGNLYVVEHTDGLSDF